MNQVLLCGRLAKDPEMRYLPDGKAVTSLRLITYAGRNEDGSSKSEGHDIVIYDREVTPAGSRGNATMVAQFLRKGRFLAVLGYLHTRSWDDANTGQKRYRTEVIANNVEWEQNAQQ